MRCECIAHDRRFCRRNTEGPGHGSIDGSRNATDVGIGTIVGEVTVRKLLYVADFNTCFFRFSAHFGQYCKQVCGVAYMAYSVSSDDDLHNCRNTKSGNLKAFVRASIKFTFNWSLSLPTLSGAPCIPRTVHNAQQRLHFFNWRVRSPWNHYWTSRRL